MKNFQFKYQNLEEVKDRIKKSAEKEYSQILILIDEKKQEIINIEKQVEESYNVKNNMSPKEYVFMNNYRDSLNNKIKRKEHELNELELKRKKKLQDLTTKHQEHKIFEKLKEKMHLEYNHEVTKLEQKNNDDIANLNYCRKEK